MSVEGDTTLRISLSVILLLVIEFLSQLIVIFLSDQVTLADYSSQSQDADDGELVLNLK